MLRRSVSSRLPKPGLGKLALLARMGRTDPAENRETDGRLNNLACFSAPDLAVHVMQIRIVDHPIVALALGRAARMIIADAMP